MESRNDAESGASGLGATAAAFLGGTGDLFHDPPGIAQQLAHGKPRRIGLATADGQQNAFMPRQRPADIARGGWRYS